MQKKVFMFLMMIGIFSLFFIQFGSTARASMLSLPDVLIGFQDLFFQPHL